MIYLATPYSDYPEGKAMAYVHACRNAAHHLRQGVVLFCPIAHTHGPAEFGGLPGDFAFWQRYDQAMMDRCDSLMVVKMLGWVESRGVAAEIDHFTAAGKPVEYVESVSG